MARFPTGPELHAPSNTRNMSKLICKEIFFIPIRFYNTNIILFYQMTCLLSVLLFFCCRQHSAGSKYILSSRSTDCTNNPCIVQCITKDFHLRQIRTFQRDVGDSMKTNQLTLQSTSLINKSGFSDVSDYH